METARFVDALLADLDALAALAPEGSDVAAAAQRLSAALGPAAGQRLLEALSEAALELSARMPSGHVEVRLVGRDPELVYVDEESLDGGPPQSGPAASARITLRLPEPLKTGIEAAAAREGSSVNSWLVRALARSLSASRPSHGRRVTGFATG